MLLCWEGGRDDRPQFIAPGLFLGSCLAESNLAALRGCGITHVLSVRRPARHECLRRDPNAQRSSPQRLPPGPTQPLPTPALNTQIGVELVPSHTSQLTYLHIPALDMPSEDLLQYFDCAFAFIDEGIAAGDEGCGRGRGRPGPGRRWGARWRGCLGQQANGALPGRPTACCRRLATPTGVLLAPPRYTQRPPPGPARRRRAGALPGRGEPLRHGGDSVPHVEAGAVPVRRAAARGGGAAVDPPQLRLPAAAPGL